jgi:hypothetical protein
MVAKLRKKPGGAEIPVAIGDFSTTKVDGTFTVAYLVYNTILNLTSQDAQVACFQNVASHLEPGGHFVIEVIVPQLQRLSGGETVIPFAFTDDYWGFDEYEVVEQGLRSHHFERVGDEIRYVSMPFRYAWPAELDLMAQLAGMKLRDRWAGWNREPFTAESRTHISVWEK